MADLTTRLLGENFEEALNTSSHYELREVIRELHRRAEQYRQNWLSLQNATGEDCHLRALEVIREIPELHRRLEAAKAERAAAREEISRKDEAQGHLARLCSERLDKILELERQLVNEKTAHAWTEVREQSAIDAARDGGTR